MTKLITVTDMIRSFSDIVARVYYKGEIFDIKKGHNIVARLSPAKTRATIGISELNNFFKEAPHLDSDDAEDFENTLKETRLLKDSGASMGWE
ncbi:MAG: antitoxin [Rickettsiales bacterium]|nr:MAG: antitoxin [Rickettsiales bacterium]